MDYEEIAGPIRAHSRTILAATAVAMLIFLAGACGLFCIEKRRARLHVQAEAAASLTRANMRLKAEVRRHSQTEKAMRRLAQIAEQAGEGIATADLTGKLQFVNATWARMHGYEDGGQLIGKHLSVFHPTNR